MKLDEAGISTILQDSRNAIVKTKISKQQAENFMEKVSRVLEDYREQFPGSTECKYRVRKWFGRVELILVVSGEKKDPFEDGKEAVERTLNKSLSDLFLAPNTEMNYIYAKGLNIIYIHSPLGEMEANLLKQPMLYAVLLGILTGLIARHLPENITAFLVNEIASPLLSLVAKIMTGIMGPVLFLSLLTAINALDSISELNNLGFKICKRFLHITDFTVILSILVGGLIFPVFGSSSIDFTPRTIIEMILNVIPTNLFTPFTENNIPQIVILGIVMGSALLIASRKVTMIPNILSEMKDWVNEVMVIVMRLMPIVPFLSIFTILAKEGGIDSLIRGWKFILAVYVCLVLSFIIKLFKVAFRCKIRIPEFLKKIRPVCMSAFVSGSGPSVIRNCYQISEDLGIDRDFSSFWVPMNQAMLSPASAICYVIAAFFVAGLTGEGISMGFLAVLFVMTVEMSMASPGLTTGWTILLPSLGFPVDYVGLLSAYKLFVKNSLAAYGVGFGFLEETEAAYVMDSFHPGQRQERPADPEKQEVSEEPGKQEKPE